MHATCGAFESVDVLDLSLKSVDVLDLSLLDLSLSHLLDGCPRTDFELTRPDLTAASDGSNHMD